MEEQKAFKLVAPYQPTGDQPQAIDALVKGLEHGDSGQVLLGVTGSGKTFTMANVIQKINRPTLVLAHNKILAAQLCSEFKEFFPENAVEYFVSYYDYYQPEAYIPKTDTYIEKDSAINDEIDKLRHSATSSLAERRDVIIVSSAVSYTHLDVYKSKAEMLCEKYSLESLFSLGNESNIKAVLKNVAKQTLTEGSEEAATDLVNFMADQIVMGDLSEYNLTKQAYIMQGMTCLLYTSRCV